MSHVWNVLPFSENRSWSNIFSYLKALEYKVKKDCCVNKMTESLLRRKKNLKRKITSKIQTLCKRIILEFNGMIQLQLHMITPTPKVTFPI